MRAGLKTLCAITVISTNCLAADYGKEMANAVQRAVGKDYTKHFKFASYPVDNYGVITSYDKHGTELCATWTCVGTDEDVPADPSKLLSVTTKAGIRYVDVGTGSPITLQDEVKRDIGIKLVLPQLAKVIGVDLDLANHKDIKADLDLGPITKRKIIPDKVMERINSLPSSSSVQQAFKAKALSIVYEDIVVKSMKVTLDVDTSANNDADAKLTGALQGKVGQVIGGNGSEISVKVDGSTKGKYVLTVTSPLILATWRKDQPETVHLAVSGIDTWNDAAKPIGKIFTVEP